MIQFSQTKNMVSVLQIIVNDNGIIESFIFLKGHLDVCVIEEFDSCYGKSGIQSNRARARLWVRGYL